MSDDGALLKAHARYLEAENDVTRLLSAIEAQEVELARLRHLLAVSVEPWRDEDHEWCDVDSGGGHQFDRASFNSAALRAALGEALG